MTQPTQLDTLRRMIGGSLVSQLVYVAVKLGLAEHLAGRPKTAAELATAVEAAPEPLYRVLRALASLGVFAEETGGRFSLTPAGACLRPGVPNSLHAYTLMCGEILWPAFGALLHSVRTGQPAFEHLHGMGVFEYFRQHPQAGEVFDAAMADLTGLQAAGVVAAYSFEGVGTLVDVGGGQGVLLAAALRAAPAMRGVLYERPEVLPAARRALEAAGLLGRCELKRGDFFTAVPEGGDLYVLKDVVHDWDDASAVRILANCARALGSASKLLVIERTVAPGGAAAGKLADVTMLAVTGGRERTEEEYAALMARAGLRLVRVVPAPGEMHVLEAVGHGRQAA